MKLKLWRLKWWREHYRYPHSRRLFQDISTCPVCTQDKPIDQFTVREIGHIEEHLKHPVLSIEEEMNIERKSRVW
jgi:hypothetical protein